MKNDIQALKKKNTCTELDRAKCKEKYDPPQLEWACKNCPKFKNDDIHPYTMKMLDVRNLQKAGFPLDADFLTYEEWLDLGKVNSWLETPKLF